MVAGESVVARAVASMLTKKDATWPQEDNDVNCGTPLPSQFPGAAVRRRS